MSSSRIKIPTTIITRSRAEELLGEIAALTIERRDLENILDQTIADARTSFEQSAGPLKKAIEDKTALLATWAQNAPDEFPKGLKSIKLTHGVVGFRTGTPKLKTLAKWTWDRVLENIKALPSLKGFLRVKEEVNKDAILSAYSEERLFPQDLRTLGVQVVQDEAFFVEPDLSKQSARTSTPAQAAA
jgi:phage host-nuclease inhibitor protein Gam